ncbi:unnamed protein product [Paramecium octaurelia]|uniref:Uncharacterized protein n=1 Tax=Paramecium octaurelia TaxID=43137 RepID=A0A8S1YAB3_PAROT|nr:unnamed protein product [Paramecium octaurelia]
MQLQINAKIKLHVINILLLNNVKQILQETLVSLVVAVKINLVQMQKIQLVTILMKCTLKSATCAAIKNEGACLAHTLGRKQQCAWNGTACADATIDCTLATGTGFTLQYCQYLSTTCSVKVDGTACLTAAANCAGIVEGSCVWASTDKFCYWNGTACAKIVDATKCSDIIGTSAAICQSKKASCTWTTGTKCTANCTAFTGPFNYDTCQAYNPQCTLKRDGTGCVMTVATCAGTSAANCTGADDGKCYLSGTTCTLASGALITATNCGSITGIGLTPAYCKGISTGGNTCSANSELTGCVEKQANCANFATTPWADCLSGNTQTKCIINSDGDGCVAYDATVANPCLTVKLFKTGPAAITYTDAICNLYGCQAKADKSGCDAISASAAVTPTCGSYTGPFTYEACIGFINTCSVNAAKTACITIKDTCTEYTTTECGYAKNEGECVVSGTACVQKNCDSAASTVTTLAGCQAVSTNCALRVGGCQFRNNCASYTVQGACVKNASGSECLWNPTAAKCVDKSCSAAEASTSFDSHTKCSNAGKCTVKATADKAIGQGCIPFAACSSYTIEEQCKKNAKDENCVWNTNTDPATCADISCATAPTASYNDHDGCKGYLSGCTVNVVDVNGTPTLQGCVAYKTCNLYNLEGQCQVSSEKDDKGANILCGWNGTSCANKSCQTAQQTVNTPALCKSYLAGCTVNATDNGCVAIPDVCEGMTVSQCYDGSVDKSSRKCFWDTTDGKCITKKCENSPNTGSESECDTYLSGCTTDTIKCKTKICEDFPLTTDALCKAALSTCTSNGVNCVKRGYCNQAQAEAGCVTDSYLKQCQWMTPTGQDAYCTNKSCTTAPTSLTTEAQCIAYFTPSVGTCTTKKEGGCTLKGACTSANVAAACITDKDKNDCQWETETSTCRLKECKDFAGTTHAACQKQKTGCTAGLNGKCAKMTNCQDIKVRAACIEGNDGPCLWIAKYVNADATLGACFSYESCKSLDWTSDPNCKLISPNCTTDGTECVGITSCAATNIKGGCKIGTDGQSYRHYLQEVYIMC